MADKLAEVLELYDMEVISARKGRGATIFTTTQGPRILEAFRGNLTRLEQEYVLKQLLVQNGFAYVDETIPNTDGILFTCDRYRQPFVLKKHYEGNECDMHSEEDMLQSVKLLARMHQSGRRVAEQIDEAWQVRCQEKEQKRLGEMRQAFENGEELERIARIYDIRENLLKEMLERTDEQVVEQKTQKEHDERKNIRNNQIFSRHNQELSKIHQYVRRVKRKNDFERLFLQVFPQFYQQGCNCVRQLEGCLNEACSDVGKQYYGICHGAYNHHNIILNKDGGAIVHFEHFTKGNQLNDLYQFTRKAMEKNHFNLELLEELLLAYDQVIPLTNGAYRYIYILFSYPEKFWKIANGYYNGNKAFLSPKYVEKLDMVICQEREKQNLLEEYFAFHLQADSI